jgi:hypothetical protein
MKKDTKSIHTSAAIKAGEAITKAMNEIKKISKQPPFMTERK